MSGWPSGLRRWIKAPISSEAWVRIPLQTIFYIFVTHIFHFYKGSGIFGEFNAMRGLWWTCGVVSGNCFNQI